MMKISWKPALALNAVQANGSWLSLALELPGLGYLIRVVITTYPLAYYRTTKAFTALLEHAVLEPIEGASGTATQRCYYSINCVLTPPRVSPESFKQRNRAASRRLSKEVSKAI